MSLKRIKILSTRVFYFTTCIHQDYDIELNQSKFGTVQRLALSYIISKNSHESRKYTDLRFLMLRRLIFVIQYHFIGVNIFKCNRFVFMGTCKIASEYLSLFVLFGYNNVMVQKLKCKTLSSYLINVIPTPCS